MKKNRNKKILSGMTLIELIVVVIIAGVVASFAVVKYNDLMETDKARKAKLTVNSIYSAGIIFQAKNGTSPSHVWGDDTLNSTFGLNINDDDFEYYLISCVTAPCNSFTAQAERQLPSSKRYMYRMHSPELSGKPGIPVASKVYCASPTYTPPGWGVECPIP